jgi:hypothetical protein
MSEENGVTERGCWSDGEGLVEGSMVAARVRGRREVTVERESRERRHEWSGGGNDIVMGEGRKRGSGRGMMDDINNIDHQI